jgi:hypothetical protein
MRGALPLTSGGLWLNMELNFGKKTQKEKYNLHFFAAFSRNNENNAGLCRK